MGLVKLPSLEGACFYVVKANDNRIILEQDNGGMPGDIYVIEAKPGPQGADFSYLEVKKT